MDLSGHFTHRPLYPQGKNPTYPFDRRSGGPQSRSGRGGEEKNSENSMGVTVPKPNSLFKCYCMWVVEGTLLRVSITPLYSVPDMGIWKVEGSTRQV